MRKTIISVIVLFVTALYGCHRGEEEIEEGTAYVKNETDIILPDEGDDNGLHIDVDSQWVDTIKVEF